MTTRPAGLLTAPVVAGSLGLLIVNDHVLKAAFHNTLTGKLSDFAGLVFFPVLVVSIVEVLAWAVGGWTPSRSKLLLAAGLLTAAGFAGIQTVEPATELYRSIAGLLTGRQTMVVSDPTDLMALPACFVGWWLERRLSYPQPEAQPSAAAKDTVSPAKPIKVSLPSKI